MARAFVGIGANLGDREATIRAALDRLAARADVAVVAVSPLRETAPVGYLDQPPFLNGAAELATTLAPAALLAALLDVERALGRVRGAGPRYGPRPIDLDLLLYEGEVVDEPRGVGPHPRQHARRVAREPHAHRDPAHLVPRRGPVSSLHPEL
ncbi:MAG: 2-amino-4-hydroxy-6-hydroxymethyldihydropteridine diphosphokinase, partial [Pseudomonadota bacterium]